MTSITSRVERVIVELGLSEQARRVFWGVKRRQVRGEMNVSVGDASATFHVPTYSTYRAVKGARNDEKAVIRELLSHIRPNDTVWDVGANIGTHTCLVGSILEGGEVRAFEPFEPNIDVLRKNIELNNTPATISPYALSNMDGTVDFTLPYSQSAGSQQGTLSGEYTNEHHVVETVTVQTRLGDDVVDETQPPDVIKLDVEGAGPQVLEGLTETIRTPGTRARLLAIEPHENWAEIRDILDEAGYDVFEPVYNTDSEQVRMWFVSLSE